MSGLVLYVIILLSLFIWGVVSYRDVAKESASTNPLPDIETSILDLIVISLRTGGELTMPKLLKVKQFLLNGFGEERARAMFYKMRYKLKGEPVTDFRRQCVRINEKLTYRQKLALLNLFLAIASVDKLQSSAIEFMGLYVRYTRISSDDFKMLRNRYFQYSDWSAQEGNSSRQTQPKRPKRDALEDAYRELGLTVDADLEQVRRSYRKLAMKWHPDRFTSASEAEVAEATIKFRSITQAYKKIMQAKS